MPIPEDVNLDMEDMSEDDNVESIMDDMSDDDDAEVMVTRL